jgi:L-aspartate oxidase
MGGVVCDLDGRTTLPGLLAVGECACTGVHGANRLASNSLTECFVFGARAAAAAATAEPGAPVPAPDWRFGPPKETTRDAVWRDAGPRRDPTGLERLLGDPYPLARMIALAALERRESRGPHRRSDLPRQDRALDGLHVAIGPAGVARRERWD